MTDLSYDFHRESTEEFIARVRRNRIARERRERVACAIIMLIGLLVAAIFVFGLSAH